MRQYLSVVLYAGVAYATRPGQVQAHLAARSGKAGNATIGGNHPVQQGSAATGGTATGGTVTQAGNGAIGGDQPVQQGSTATQVKQMISDLITRLQAEEGEEAGHKVKQMISDLITRLQAEEGEEAGHKVKQMISDLITRLQAEEGEEAGHKATSMNTSATTASTTNASVTTNTPVGPAAGVVGTCPPCPDSITVEECDVLLRHNTFRCMHGVPPLMWNADLVAKADTVAQTGAFIHSSDEFRDGANENMEWGATLSGLQAVDSWYDEIGQSMGGLVNESCAMAESCFNSIGHYTQVVWKGTLELGCAKGAATEQGVSGEMWVCMYKAAGNQGGQYEASVLKHSQTLAHCNDICWAPPPGAASLPAGLQ